MNSHKKKLRSRNKSEDKAQILARMGAMFLASTVAVPALAQQQTAEDDDAIEEVVVTGSYIRRDNFDSFSPVSVISVEDIQQAGTTNTADLIFNLPQNVGTEVLANPGASGSSSSSLRTGGSSQGGIGLANLRGLGPRATMNLLDGHRLAFGDANFSYPQIAIERIEVLLDGASALYGSEAVAGVVNYIPAKRFDGFKVQFERKDQLDVSAPDDKFALLMGQEAERSNFLFAVEYRNRERLEQRDFSKYYNKSYNEAFAATGFPGSAFLPRRNATGAITANLQRPTDRRIDPGCGATFMNPGLTDITDNYQTRWGTPSTTGQTCGTNFGQILDWNSELEQLHGYARFEYELTDNITFDTDVIFGRQDFNTRSTPGPLVANDLLPVPGDLAGNPYRAFTDANFNGTIDTGERLLFARDTCNFVDCARGDGFPDRDANGDGIADPIAQGKFGFPVLLPSATADANGNGIPDRFDAASGVAFNEDVTLTAWSPFGKNSSGRPDGMNADGSIDRARVTDNLRIGAGFVVEIPDTSWRVDAHAIWAQREQNYALAFGSVANFSTPQLTAAFACVNPADMAAGRCMQFNPFSTSQFDIVNRVPTGNATSPTSLAFNTREEANAIFTFNDDITLSTNKLLDIVVTGDLFELPAGTLAMAAGYNYRRLESETKPNQLNSTSTNTFGTAIQAQDAYLEAHDVFAEFSVPIFENDFLGRLEASLAARYTDNEGSARLGLQTDAAFDDTVTKVGLLWQPLEWVSLRATYGEGFVVPEIADLFQGAREAQRNVADATCSVILPVVIPAPTDTSIQPVCNYTPPVAPATVPTVAAANLQTEIISGNPQLEPESSESYNYGITFSLLEGDLVLQADYFTVDYENVIFSLTSGLIASDETTRFQAFYVGRCGAEPTTGPGSATQVACATQARRDWITGGGQSARITRQADPVSGLPIGPVESVLGDFVNVLTQEVTATDVMASYRFSAQDLPWIGGDWGNFNARLQGTYMETYLFQINPSSLPIQGVGKRNDETGATQIPAVPRWRGLASLGWNNGNHIARMSGRYHDAITDFNVVGDIRAANLQGYIPSATYWDLYYQYNLGDRFGLGDTEISLNLSNVFNKQPSAIEDDGGIDTNLDNPLGRLLTLRVSHTF